MAEAGLDPRRWADDPSLTAKLLRWVPLVLIAVAMAVQIARKVSGKAYVIVDDQMLHVVPFRYFLPGSHLQRNHIIDFFLSENSFLYDWLFILPARAGIEPTLTATVIALLSLVGALVGVHAISRAGGGSLAAAAGTVVLMLTLLGGRDDIAIGSARTIGWPLLVAALWAVIAGRRLWFAVFAGLGALIYPSVAVIAIGTAGLFVLVDAMRERDFGPALRWAGALAVPCLALVGFTMSGGDWGPTISESQARSLPEFGPGGRSEYYFSNPWYFYLVASRSALIDTRFFSMVHLSAFALAGCFLKPPRLLAQLVGALVLTSVMLWALAHLLLYTLYLPARFPSYGLTLAAVLMAGWTIGVIVARFRFGAWLVAAVLVLWAILRMATSSYPFLAIATPPTPNLFDRINASPSYGTVAGVSKQLDFVTAATGRPILWSRETAVPYKLRYRAEVARQLQVASVAVLSDDPAPLMRWVADNDIEWVMVDDEVFQLGAQARLIARTPGGDELAGRLPVPSGSWLARQDACALRERYTRLYDVACLGRALATGPAEPPAAAAGAAPATGP